MPIDTPYNRMVTDQYNAIIRNKVDHEMDTLQTVMPSPAGMYNTGYEPKMMGSGVGIYNKVGSGMARGEGMARGAYSAYSGHGRAYGGNNLGLQPEVRAELALGAGLRGNRTSKHGCLDRHDEFNGSGKKDCPLGHEVCNCGMGKARGGFGIQDLLGLIGMGEEEGEIEGGFLSELLSKIGLGKAQGAGLARGGFGIKDILGLLGLGVKEGRVSGGFLSDILSKLGLVKARGGKGAKGFKPKSAPKKAAPKKAPAKAPAKKPDAKKPDAKKPAAKKPEEKKKEESTFTKLGNMASSAAKTAEDVVKGVEKAADIGEKAFKYGKMGLNAYNALTGKAPVGPAPAPAPDAEAPAGSGKRGVNRRLRHAEAVRGVSANGKARGAASGGRAAIVKQIMKKMALPLIKASQYVKEHGLYKSKASGGLKCKKSNGKTYCL